MITNNNESLGKLINRYFSFQSQVENIQINYMEEQKQNLKTLSEELKNKIITSGEVNFQRLSIISFNHFSSKWKNKLSC